VNLVNNAVKFTERGAVTVRLRSLERAGKRMQLEIEVHDTGIGMTSEQCEKLYQAFSQATVPSRASTAGPGSA
jgi:signal transduction histidine kinase